MPQWRSARPTTRSSRGEVLLAHARAAIAGPLLGRWPAVDESPAWLHDEGACFVTLTTHGRLRGCIGTVEPYRTLLADVRGNALAAATRDRRFPPLTAAELEDTVIDVSVLSAATPFPVRDEADACARLRPGIDGVVLECGPRRATFLPQVWDRLTDPREFLARLKQKAGLPASYWGDDVRLSRYTVTEYREEGQEP
jgi:AmmeMemoRadiSam system protein A